MLDSSHSPDTNMPLLSFFFFFFLGLRKPKVANILASIQNSLLVSQFPCQRKQNCTSAQSLFLAERHQHEGHKLI